MSDSLPVRTVVDKDLGEKSVIELLLDIQEIVFNLRMYTINAQKEIDARLQMLNKRERAGQWGNAGHEPFG